MDQSARQTHEKKTTKQLINITMLQWARARNLSIFIQLHTYSTALAFTVQHLISQHSSDLLWAISYHLWHLDCRGCRLNPARSLGFPLGTAVDFRSRALPLLNSWTQFIKIPQPNNSLFHADTLFFFAPALYLPDTWDSLPFYLYKQSGYQSLSQSPRTYSQLQCVISKCRLGVRVTGEQEDVLLRVQSLWGNKLGLNCQTFSAYVQCFAVI